MATVTLGTTAQTSLTALKFLPGYGSGMAAADIATINNLIKNDLQNTNPRMGGMYFSAEGRLYMPNRGLQPVQLMPGDYVGVDNQGFPIVVSKNSIANGAWVHT